MHRTRIFKKIPKIGGNGKIVEIDEEKFGKRKYNRGHRVDGVWVLGMVERSPSRKIVLISVDKRDITFIDRTKCIVRFQY
jgi:hypothetical protein